MDGDKLEESIKFDKNHIEEINYSITRKEQTIEDLQDDIEDESE